MRIAEIYKSIQGEGFLTGTESVFVRTSGCNLRCWFCDTPYTSWTPDGEDLAVDEIAARVGEHNCSHVVVTGGEPMLMSELIPFCTVLRSLELHITIETAATLYLPVDCDLMSLSPKLANSTPSAERAGPWRDRHERTRHTPQVVQRLIAEYPYQLKFVVDTPDDLTQIDDYLRWFPEIDRKRVLLMPQGTDIDQLSHRATWLEPYCRQQGFHFCPRRQIEWYGLVRET